MKPSLVFDSFLELKIFVMLSHVRYKFKLMLDFDTKVNYTCCRFLSKRSQVLLYLGGFVFWIVFPTFFVYCKFSFVLAIHLTSDW